MAEGVVVYWDAPTLKGVVLVDEEPYQFLSTSFFSVPSRFPVYSEKVEVVFRSGTDKKEILAVRALDNKTPLAEEIEAFHQRSGSVTSEDPLVSFLYILMRDHVAPGVLEGIMREHPHKMGDTSKFTNGWLASYAKDLADRLS